MSTHIWLLGADVPLELIATRVADYRHFGRRIAAGADLASRPSLGSGMLSDVRAAGSGINTWRVRVNLFTDAVEPNGLVTPCADALLSEVGSSREQRMPGEAGVDRGYGWEKRPVIGFNFWVRADDPGTATETAVDTARRAAESASAGQVGPDIAVIVISPADAVTMPLDDFVGVD